MISFLGLFTISKGIKQYFPRKRLKKILTFNFKLIDERRKTKQEKY